MQKTLLLNDLLQLSQEDLDRAKVKFNQYNGEIAPMEVYLRNPDDINNAWLFWRAKRRYFNVGEIAICLFQLSWNTWLLSTIKEVTQELGVNDGVNYEGRELERYQSYFGRVIVKYRKTHQTQVMFAKKVFGDLEVEQILPSMFDGIDFPGYDRVRLSYEQLSTIIHRHKRDWVAALENQKAVYLITDMASGKHYVGSAYGENGMLLQRWKDAKDRIIDLHVFEFNEQGYLVFEGETYPPNVFSGIGKIGDKVVKCIDAENQVLFHMGYEHDENDIHDVRLLCERFNVPIPKEYK